MAERRPLVLKDGRIQELPVGDTVVGGGSSGGGGDPSKSHRYWRVVAQGSGNRYLICNQLIFSTQEGGPQLAAGGTAIASGRYGANTDQGYAFDTDPATYWEGNGSPYQYPGIWLGYDFGTPVEVNSFKWTVLSTSYPEEFPISGVVQWSDDNAVWNDSWQFNGLTWAGSGYMTNTVTRVGTGDPKDIPDLAGNALKILGVKADESGLEWVTKPSGGGGGGSADIIDTETGPSGYYGGLPAYKMWRILGQLWSSEQYTSLSNLEFRTAIDVAETNGSTGGTSFMSRQYSGNNPSSYAFDGLDNTYAIVDNPQPSYIGFNFPVPRVVVQVAMRNRSDGYYHQAPYKFVVQASNDGVVWDDIWTVTTDAWTSLVQRSFTRPDAGEAGDERHHYPTKLAALNDVDLTTPATSGQALVWDNASKKFKPGSVASGAGGSGGQSAVGAHRYWGLLEMKSPTGNLRFQAVSFANKGARIMPAEFVASSAYSGEYSASQLMDDVGNHWASVDTFGWLYARFANPVSIDEIGLMPVNGLINHSAFQVTFAWSDDGKNWNVLNDAAIDVNNDYAQGAFTKYKLPTNNPIDVDTTRVRASKWRLRMLTRTAQGSGSIATMEWLDTGGVNLVGLGTPIASGYYDNSATYAPANAFDGSATTAWWSRNGYPGAGEWLGYDFGNVVTPTKLRITPTPSYPNAAPDNFAVDYFQNGSWHELCQFDSLGWAEGEVREFVLPEKFKVVNSGAGPVNGTMTQPYVVQFGTLRNDGTLALTSPPTPGNVLLFVAGGWAGSINNYQPNGWIPLGSARSNENNGVLASWKLVDSADPVSIALSAGDNQFCAVYEIANAGSLVFLGNGTNVFDGTSTPNFNVKVPTLTQSPTDLFFFVFEEDNSHGVTISSPGFTMDMMVNYGGNHGGIIGRYDTTFVSPLQGNSSGADAPIWGVWRVSGKFTPA